MSFTRLLGSDISVGDMGGIIIAIYSILLLLSIVFLNIVVVLV
jgi:hypothetical protein